MASPTSTGGGAPKPSYMPEPNERAYYTGLFRAADVEKTGKIGGAQAVQFFQRSGLSLDALKNVWTIADHPPTNYLDPPKFATAVRLIQFVQNQTKGQNANLATPPGVTLRPAFFEGVTGVTVQPPPSAPGGGGGGSSPQQQPPPRGPPQQQQQQQQQPPMRATTPNTPPRPPTGGPPTGGPPMPSTALTVQDPYTLTPNEQARYEELFPNYAAEDGYVYGQAAVELFSKSGVPQPQLAAIWNMVDSPVDNRLDKLEFAMAMHLIVCVGRKNLPMPGGLPPSLQQLKAQQSKGSIGGGGSTGGPPSIQRVPTQDSMGSTPGRVGGGPPQQMTRGPSPAMGGPPPSQPQQQQQRPQMAPMRVPSPTVAGPTPPHSPSLGGLPQQSPQQHQPAPMSMGGPPPTQMNRGPSPAMGGGMSMYSQPAQQQQIPISQTAPQAPAPAPVSMDSSSLPGPPPLGTGSDGGLSISDAFEGLSATGDSRSYSSAPPSMEPTSFSNFSVPAPSPATIPEVPAPSDKPSVSTIPEPEASGPAPEPAHVAAAEPAQLSSSYQMGSQTEEAMKLKATLQKLQAENVSLKAQLGSLSEEELQVQKEVNATVAEISKLSQELTTLRAQVLAAKTRLLEATAELKANHDKKRDMTDLIAEATATKEAIDEATKGIETYMDQASKHPLPSAPSPAASAVMEDDLFGFGPSPGQGSLPPPETQSHDSLPAPSELSKPYSSDPYNSEPAPTPEPEPVPEPTPYSIPEPSSMENAPASSLDYYQHQPQREYGQSNMHKRIESTASAFGDDFIMGAGGGMFSTAPADSHNDDDHDHTIMGSPSLGTVKSVPEINELKMKAKEAEDVARDAQENSRQKMAQVDELRRLADEANAEARRFADTGKDEKKKKGFMGRNKKPTKKDVKEAERVAADAKEKQERLMAAQAEANDAQAFAVETKREAERLRQEVEDAELAAASAASMQDTAPALAAAQSNGYNPGTAEPPSYGKPPPNPYYGGGSNDHPPSSYGYGQPPQQQTNGGQQQFGGYGYNPSVMGTGGGMNIPTPTGAYDNPFGE